VVVVGATVVVVVGEVMPTGTPGGPVAAVVEVVREVVGVVVVARRVVVVVDFGWFGTGVRNRLDCGEAITTATRASTWPNPRM
jgi:hypothetical protein